jgi:hypothetical protein
VVRRASRFIQRMATSSHHSRHQLEANLAQVNNNSPPTRKKVTRDDEHSRSRSKSTDRGGDDNQSGVLSANMDERNTSSGELIVAENPLLSPRSERRRDRRSARAGSTENDTTLISSSSERKHRGHRSTIRSASPNQANDDDGSHPTEGDASRSSRRRGHSSSSRTHRRARSKCSGPSEQNESSYYDVNGQNSTIITPSLGESIHNSGHSDSLCESQDPAVSSSSTQHPDDRSRSPSHRRQSRRSIAKAAFAMSLSPPLGRKSMTWSLGSVPKSPGIGITRRSAHSTKSASSYEPLEKNEEVSLHLTPDDFLEYKRRSSSVTTTSTLPFSDSVVSLDHEE